MERADAELEAAARSEIERDLDAPRGAPRVGELHSEREALEGVARDVDDLPARVAFGNVGAERSGAGLHVDPLPLAEEEEDEEPGDRDQAEPGAEREAGPHAMKLPASTVPPAPMP